MSEVDTRVALDLHPENVKQIEGWEDGDVAAVLAPTMEAFDTAYRGIAAVHDARAAGAKNPTWNANQIIIATDEYAQKQFARIAKGFDTTRTNLERGIASIEKELSAPIESRAAVTVATEIRGYIRGLDASERLTLVRNAIANGDHSTATAVLGAPAYLSGLTPEMQRVLTVEYHSTHNPQTAKRLKAMQGAVALIDQRSGLVFKELEKAVGAHPAKARVLKEAKAAAEKAFVMSGN